MSTIDELKKYFIERGETLSTKEIINLLQSAASSFKGSAGIATNPGIPTSPEFYFPKETGTYANFKDASNASLTLAAGEIAYFVFTTNAWEKVVISGQGIAKLEDLEAAFKVSIFDQGFIPKAYAIGTGNQAIPNTPYSASGTGIRVLANGSSSSTPYVFTSEGWNTNFANLVGKRIRYGFVIEMPAAIINNPAIFDSIKLRVYRGGSWVDLNFDRSFIIGSNRKRFEVEYTITAADTSITAWWQLKAGLSPTTDYDFKTVTADFYIKDVEVTFSSLVLTLKEYILPLSTLINQKTVKNFLNPVWGGQALNGATKNGATISIPAGASGNSSYFQFTGVINPINFLSEYVNKRVKYEFLVKTTNFTSGSFDPYGFGANPSAGAKFVANSKYTTLLATSGPDKYYSIGFEVDITSAYTYLNPSLQLINSVPYAAAVELSVLSVSITAKDITGAVSSDNDFNFMVDRKVRQFVNEAKAGFQIVPEIVVLTVRKSADGGSYNFTGNRAIQDAIESITDATKEKQYVILVHDGIYEALTTAEFNSSGSGAGNYAFIRGKNYVSIRGVSKEKVIIRGELPNNLGTSFPYLAYQTMYWHANFGTLENITITGKNLRYPIHIDGGTPGLADFYNKFRNIAVEHFGNSGHALNWGSFHPIGLGTSQGQVIEHEGVELKSQGNALYMHTNANFNKESRLIYKNCRFISSSTTIATIQSLGSRRNDEVLLHGCSFDGKAYLLVGNDIPYIPSNLSEQSYNHCEVKIKGYGNGPFIWVPNYNGKALKITSKSTGLSSSVRFDPLSSAFPLIIKDKDYLGGQHTDIFGEVSKDGYAFGDGDVLINGYAIGRLDIGSEATYAGTYIKSLGKRLGDCSVSNKVLTVFIDGSSHNITFSKNYTEMTNASIIAEIVNVIGGVATVTEYAVGNDYFPEFTDVVKYCAASESILKGMAVVKVGNSVRRATSADKKIYGVALDPIRTTGMGRVLTSGYISSNESDRFSSLQENYSAVLKGDELGISSASGKLSKTAVNKHFFAIDDHVLSFNL